MAVAQLTQLAQSIKAGLSCPAPKLEELKGLARQVKLVLTTLPSQTGAASSAEERGAACAALEGAALVALSAKDTRGFERTVAQMRSCWEQEGAPEPAAEELRRRMLGLLLMLLLVEQRLPELHSQVELLSAGDRESSWVAFPLRLEAALMEGGYNKVLAAGAAAPSPYYGLLLSQLADTVREETADCISASYKHISLAAAARMLAMPSQKALADYVAAHRPSWFIEGASIRIVQQLPEAGGELAAAAAAGGSTAQAAAAAGSSGAAPVAALQLITQTLAYATEVERIV